MWRRRARLHGEYYQRWGGWQYIFFKPWKLQRPHEWAVRPGLFIRQSLCSSFLQSLSFRFMCDTKHASFCLVLSCLVLPCHSVRRSRDCTGLPSAGLCTWDEKTVTVAQGQPFAYRSTMPLSHYLRGVMNYYRRRAPQVVSTVAPTVAVGYYNSTATDCRTIAHKIIQTIFIKMARKLVQNCLLQYPGKSTKTQRRWY